MTTQRIRRYGARWALLADGVLVGVAFTKSAAEAWRSSV